MFSVAYRTLSRVAVSESCLPKLIPNLRLLGNHTSDTWR
jgi:hypothetical protein